MRIVKFQFIILVLLSISFAGYGQKSVYRYSKLDIDDGLTNNSINSIIQDSRGYIWFGTYYGLNRYNGYEIKNYYNESDNPHSVSDNFTTSLLEDIDGNIWVGTKFGLNRFDKNTEKFSRYLVDSTQIGSIVNNQIGSLSTDSENNIWVGTMGGGLHLYHHASDNFTAFVQNEKNYSHINYISSMVNGSDHELWLGTYGNGIALFNKSQKSFLHFPFNNMQINDLYDDKRGVIWIATNNMGLYRFIKKTRTYEKFTFLNDKEDSDINIIMSFSNTPDGHLLVCADGGGIVIIDTEKSIVLKNNEQSKAFQGLDTKAIYRVYFDSNNLYWIGTIGKGIRQLNMERNRFSYFINEENNPSSLSENAVISLLQDKKNRIWVGTDGGGLNLFNPEKGTFRSFQKLSSNLKSNVIKCIYEGDDESLWLGTYGGGLAQFNTKTESFVSYNPIESSTNEQLYLSVWSLEQQSKGQLWVGTLGNGLFSFDIKTKKFTPLKTLYPELDEVMNDYILSLRVDSKNNLWIGTSNGIYLWDRTSDSYSRWLFDDQNHSGVGKNAILSIYESHNKKVWVGSNGGGIVIIDPDNESLLELNKSDGLVHEQVYDITQDHNNSIWIATQGGVSKYEIETGRFQNYDNRDGLMGSAFNTLLSSLSNQILVGGVKGLNVFNPNVIKINNYVPKVQLSELLINNVVVKAGDLNSPLKQNITETKELILNHNQANIGIEFVALNFFSEKNSYSYMLENSSEDWSKSSFNRNVKFNNLKPGSYVFRVKAANNDGIWSTSETKLHITILAPWWKTWYAFLIYFLILGAIIYGYIRYSILWIDLRRKLQFEVMEREKIKELNQLRLQFFTNISHEFRTPLTLITGPLEALRKKLKLNQEESDLFNIMHKNTNLLLRLINQVMDFRKVETGSMELNVSSGDIISALKDSANAFAYMANERNMSFEVQTEIKQLYIQFDVDIIEKVIYNLLSNAFKYGKENGNVSLSISEQICEDSEIRRCLIITVSDDGPGIQSDNPEKVFEQYKQFNQGINKHQPGTGIGLPLTKSLVELHGGKLSVRSEKDKGATFTISIPIVEAEGQFVVTEKPTQTHLNKNYYFDTTVKNANSKPDKTHKYNLLVVDDNKEVVDYLQNILQDHYNLDKAYDGEQALDLMMRRSFDLLITDVMMPKMNGVELCHTLKTEIQTSHIPIIMLSAKSSVEDRIEGISIGADAYVPKPFNPDLLLAYIENLLRSREKLKEIFTGNSIIVPSEVTSSSVDEKFVSKALEVVKKNMEDEEFGVVELGQELNMSRSNLHRKLKAITGKSSTDFIRTIRLKEAAAKLISTDDQIAEIAYKVGFNSSSYFIKSFKKEFNMSPGQYKQMQQKWN